MGGKIEVNVSGKLFAPGVTRLVEGAIRDGVLDLAELGADLGRSQWSGVSSAYAGTIAVFHKGDDQFASVHSRIYGRPYPVAKHRGAGRIGQPGVYVSTWLEEGRRSSSGTATKARRSAFLTKSGKARMAQGFRRWNLTFKAVDAVDRLSWFGGRVTKVLE